MEFIIESVNHNPIVRMVILWVMADTLFGVLRAFKEHNLNSSFGINGGIRKIGTIFGMLILMIADSIIHMNLAFMLPQEFLHIVGLERVGITEFFGIMFVLYETISLLKNMILIGIWAPKWLKVWLESFLDTMTNEMPKTIEYKNTMEGRKR